MIVIYKEGTELKIGTISKEELLSFSKNLCIEEDEYCVIEGTVIKDFNQKLVEYKGGLQGVDMNAPPHLAALLKNRFNILGD